MEMQLTMVRKIYGILKDNFCYECQNGNCEDCKIGDIREQVVELEKELERKGEIHD